MSKNNLLKAGQHQNPRKTLWTPASSAWHWAAVISEDGSREESAQPSTSPEHAPTQAV